MQRTSSSNTRTELVRRLQRLAGVALPRGNDPTNAAFGGVQGGVPVVDDPNALAASINTAFSSLLQSLAGTLPPQQVDTMSIGSPKEALDEALNQAQQVLTLATPANPVVASLVAAMKARPIDVALKDGPTGLSTSLPSDLSGIRRATEKIAFGGPPPPDPGKGPPVDDSVPKMVGDRVFSAGQSPFMATVKIRGGQAPYALAIASPPAGDVKFSPVGGDPQTFTLTAFPPDGLGVGKPSDTLQVVVTDVKGKASTPQLVAIDWESYLRNVQHQVRITLDPTFPGVNVVLGAVAQTYELRLRVTDPPATFTLAVAGSSTDPVYRLDGGKLKVWADLAFLLDPRLPQPVQFVVTMQDEDGRPIGSCPVPVSYVQGPALKLEGLGGQIVTHAGESVSVRGYGIAPGATAALVRQ
jgi:hypothetical protein